MSLWFSIYLSLENTIDSNVIIYAIIATVDILILHRDNLTAYSQKSKLTVIILTKASRKSHLGYAGSRPGPSSGSDQPANIGT
ncbi:hypothetical protein CFIMG_005222RA [Ceratocystis fimbriata CBS 114723]|uniref:Uncharacterized protein n=1 Tax=Ceratocystis fimbriata CBS 114723 TaxID=1035309 RepID=A0A2C5WZ18_9PEZI|nr:hypothetical protein CFIMG_005222RA [Ceratocystis fimbriata CBS 114723]